mmetsp:Transcript_12921/g.35761  ORF Transcript_12921/g.35761 Transcript_12921/m.35761 type:complete len:202 (+) Transcript_12921:1027-1632(+)
MAKKQGTITGTNSAVSTPEIAGPKTTSTSAAVGRMTMIETMISDRRASIESPRPHQIPNKMTQNLLLLRIRNTTIESLHLVEATMNHQCMNYQRNNPGMGCKVCRQFRATTEQTLAPIGHNCNESVRPARRKSRNIERGLSSAPPFQPKSELKNYEKWNNMLPNASRALRRKVEKPKKVTTLRRNKDKLRSYEILPDRFTV